MCFKKNLSHQSKSSKMKECCGHLTIKSQRSQFLNIIFKDLDAFTKHFLNDLDFDFEIVLDFSTLALNFRSC